MHREGLLLTTGQTLLAGVIGWPVRHSRSPAIHSAAAAASGADFVYVAFPVEPGAARAALDAVRSLGLRGLSVTMPHKEEVIAGLDDLTDAARALGAVNCVINNDGHLTGDNTDGDGFVRGLQHQHGNVVADAEIVVLGAGGAARAIVDACARHHAGRITVLNRTTDRARDAAALAGARGRVNEWAALASADVVVNATPCGMAGTEQADLMPVDVDLVRRDALVVDIVYDPRLTPLLAAATARGHTVQGGLPMLAGQAQAQFAAWTGHEVSLDVLINAAEG